MHRLFRRRFAVELSQNIQRLNSSVKSKGGWQPLDSPRRQYSSSTCRGDTVDDNNLEETKLDTLFKRGHRADFLVYVFEQQAVSQAKGRVGGAPWSLFVMSWVHKLCIQIHRREHDYHRADDRLDNQHKSCKRKRLFDSVGVFFIRR